ncbi:ATP-binding protein [Pseudoflavonifractor sp. 524-17]|uniref:sensor histidine kinase n=1 Tax=Pseudoflavonifractor sp. 524-17 TaxID=2304577 RepID=UPI0013796AAF|nr:ATP-binding protein [Pseudoflavonifractor sp. 524-17]NCE66145.1 ATP-binding protein [Pseudoflavonifractor sp. 524-17]
MTDIFLLFSGMLSGALRVLAGLIVISRLLSAKKPSRKSIVAGLAGALIFTVLVSRLHMSDLCRMTLEILLIAACAHWLEGTELRISLFVSMFYEIGLSFWQFLLTAGLGVLFRSQDFLSAETAAGQSALWLLHGLLAGLAVWCATRQRIARKAAFRAVSAASLAGFLAVITLSEQAVLAIPDDTLYMWTILAVILMMSVLVFNLNRQYEVEKELAALKSEQAELLERDYTAVTRAYQVNAKLFHDFHNHIGVLRQLLSHEKYGETVRYLDELQAPVQNLAATVWTGDETADYLINSKAAAAEAGGIQFQRHVEFPQHTNIRSADLCAILGNLLDNAVEAARQVPDPHRRTVSLTIRRIHQMLVIKVENSFSTAPIQENGALKTTKTEGGLHGWGLKSAQTAAEKYDGMVQAGVSGEVFRAVATLSYHGIECSDTSDTEEGRNPA